jgi:hypothetical protein
MVIKGSKEVTGVIWGFVGGIHGDVRGKVNKITNHRGPDRLRIQT